MQEFIVDTPTQMIELGSRVMRDSLQEISNSPLLFLLSGELGSGKTQFAKGVAKGLDIESIVTSPSYVYMQEYEFTFNDKQGILLHIDAWRLEDKMQFQSLDIQKYLLPMNILVVEWPRDFLSDYTDLPYLRVEIEEIEGDGRKVTISGPDF